MKKLFIVACATVVAANLFAQMNVWENGALSAQYAIENVDSVTFGITSVTPESGTGKDGITPLLKIENDYWYVSYDEGVTWHQEGKAKGEQGIQGEVGPRGEKGEKGDSMFQSVTHDSNFVYLTLLDSTVVKIAKAQENSNTQPSGDVFINFRDLGVKSALLKAEVDKNSDGEISYDEAKIFSGELNFAANANIYSFKEFQYFTNVANFTFRECTNLFEIELPNNLTTISSWTFYGCKSITRVSLPNNITTIDSHAFRECSSLLTINFPDGLTSIGSQAFYECSSLKSVAIPNTVTSIGSDAFGKCTNLTLVNYPEKLSSFVVFYTPANVKTVYWDVTNMDYALMRGTNDTYYGLGSNYYIGYNTGYSSNTSIENVIFGEKVQRIPGYLCHYLYNLEEITIPNSVTSIGSYAFNGCKSLSSVSIGENVTSIESAAFDGCTSLVSITFPKKITIIEGNAFNLCSSLKYCYSKAETPPILETNALPSTIGIIYVPRASVDEYRALWSDYANKIVGYDFE